MRDTHILINISQYGAFCTEAIYFLEFYTSDAFCTLSLASINVDARMEYHSRKYQLIIGYYQETTNQP